MTKLMTRLAPLAEYYYKHTNSKSVYAMVSSICTDQTGIQSVATGKRHQIVIKHPSLPESKSTKEISFEPCQQYNVNDTIFFA